MHGSMRVQVRKSTVARPTKARPKVKPNSFSVGLRPAAFFSPLISLSLSALSPLFLHLLFSLRRLVIVAIFTIFFFRILENRKERVGSRKGVSPKTKVADN